MFTVPLFVQFLPRPLPTPVRSVAIVVTPLVVSVPVPVMSAPLFHAKLPFNVTLPAPLSVTVSPPVNVNGLPSARFAFAFTTPPLTTTAPLPVTLVPAFRLRVPPLNCSVAPAVTLYAPLSAPPPSTRHVPACAFNVPALLNVTPLCAFSVPAALLLKVPRLVNTCPELLATVSGVATVEPMLNIPPAALVKVEGALK